MGTPVAAAQPLLIGLLLLWSSYGKFADPKQAERTALPRLVGESRAITAYRAVAGIEALVALALLLPPVWTVEAIAAVALAAGFTGFLIYSKIVVPEASCGCTEGVGETRRRAGDRRALLLLATAVMATTARPVGGRRAPACWCSSSRRRCS